MDLIKIMNGRRWMEYPSPALYNKMILLENKA
jgi:hypothetical protein